MPSSNSITYGNLPTKDVLTGAQETELTNVIVIGWNDAIGKLYTASSTGDGGTILLMLELAKNKLIEALDFE